jgi:hypothetical protein
MPTNRMALSLVLWTAVYLTCNVIGVKMLEATLETPLPEIARPALLTVCLMGLAAIAVCRILTGWRELTGWRQSPPEDA